MTKILIVDDEPAFLRIYQRALARKNYQTVQARNSQEAFEMLESMEVKPDLVLLDIAMPKINGLEFLSGIKEDARFKHIPIIILTNLNGSENQGEKAIALGASLYLEKGADSLDALMENIEKVLKKSKRVKTIERA